MNVSDLRPAEAWGAWRTLHSPSWQTMLQSLNPFSRQVQVLQHVLCFLQSATPQTKHIFHSFPATRRLKAGKNKPSDCFGQNQIDICILRGEWKLKERRSSCKCHAVDQFWDLILLPWHVKFVKGKCLKHTFSCYSSLYLCCWHTQI